MKNDKKVFPFASVVGQEDIKKALIWNLINPAIGGVLICGQKGTAKSTLVRGLCALSDDVTLVELPLNITEDRLVGSIDFEHAVKYGEKKPEYGLLKEADGNILYIDEVNLLSDHIVKSLVDTASSGVNIIEREGVSFSHSSRFIMVGSMNPEEGNLRPQFLDRFGLYVDVKSEPDVRKRTEIIRRRLSFESRDQEFAQTSEKQSRELHGKISQARRAVSNVTVTENAMQIATVVAQEANCEGHRAELILVETAKAIAAWDGRKTINISDVKEAARFVLPHRSRDEGEQPPADPPPMENENEQTDQEDNGENQEPQEDPQDEQQEEDPGEMEGMPEEEPEYNDQPEEQKDDGSNEEPPQEQPQEDPEMNSNVDDFNDQDLVEAPGELFQVSKWLTDRSRETIKSGSGKRSVVKTTTRQGRYVRYGMPSKSRTSDIAFDATIRAAAPYQSCRDAQGMALAVKSSDLRVKIREKRTGNTILFVVDASGSMGANKRMQSVKGAILSLLNDAYQKRDKVGLIAFRRQSAELLLGITRSVDLAQKELAAMPTGGRTPLEAGLNLAYDVIKAAKVKDKDLMPVIVLISDGKATYSKNSKDPLQAALTSARKIGAEKIRSVVIDADQSFIKLHLSEKIAKAMNADLLEIQDLKAADLVTAVKMTI